MTSTEVLRRARESFSQRAWEEAYQHLSSADDDGTLEPADLERLATAAYLCGRDSESEEGWSRTHQAHLARDDIEGAARAAFWLAFQLIHRGERARAGGWLARAGRLLDRYDPDCVERGYLLLPTAIRLVGGGDPERGHATFRAAREIGERFRDPDLVTLARHGQGRALIRMGEIERGLELLDESMAAVEAGEVSAVVAGDIYCSLIEACHELFDLRRAREWTGALSRWCDEQPDLVPYRGQCLVRRSEILQLEGSWLDAMDEARRACAELARPPGEPAAGAAYYQLGELHRLRGELDEAEEAYREAATWGRDPQPGLAQLRLAQGRLDAAKAAIRQARDRAAGSGSRSRLLPAYVEIMLAAGEEEEAEAGAAELADIASELDAPLLQAEAAGARGAILLARNDPRGAAQVLRKAWTGWQELEAPYEAARARVLLGRACRRLGDGERAELEFDAARDVFRRLGASPDLGRLDRLRRPTSRGGSHGLTPRELEVLRLVAAGGSNKSIARELSISVRTVERHVSNILGKLGVRSRAGATSWAYEHELI